MAVPRSFLFVVVVALIAKAGGNGERGATSSPKGVSRRREISYHLLRNYFFLWDCFSSAGGMEGRDRKEYVYGHSYV